MEYVNMVSAAIQSLGYPIVISIALLYGIHYWMRRIYADIITPIKEEVLVTMRAASVRGDHLLSEQIRQANAIERLVKHLYDHGKGKGQNNAD